MGIRHLVCRTRIPHAGPSSPSHAGSCGAHDDQANALKLSRSEVVRRAQSPRPTVRAFGSSDSPRLHRVPRCCGEGLVGAREIVYLRHSYRNIGHVVYRFPRAPCMGQPAGRRRLRWGSDTSSAGLASRTRDRRARPTPVHAAPTMIKPMH